MLFKCFSAIILAAVASLTLSLDASAASRFTLQNDTDKHVFVSIFSGGDQFCALEGKSRRVDAGKTETYGCTGNGTQRCRLKFYSAAEKQICKKQNNTCPNDSARKMKNGQEVVISKDEDDEFVCAFF